MAEWHLGVQQSVRHDLEKAIHAFISSRIDYCNALYFGISQSSLHRLQLVQNAAARLLTSFSRHTHITPIHSSLHWLPVRFRIDFKILMFFLELSRSCSTVFIRHFNPPPSQQSPPVLQPDGVGRP